MTLVACFLVIAARNLLVPAVVGTLLGIYWFYRGLRLLQHKRLILNTPASKIRSASMGLVEFSGVAVGPYVTTSPLKQAKCYYYRSVVWQLKQPGESTDWVKVAEESMHVPFYLDDSTDKILIDPRGAEMDLLCDFNEQYNCGESAAPEMPGRIADFLTRHEVDPRQRIKVEEYCITPKNFLFVMGTRSQNPGLDATVMPSWAERTDRRFPQVGDKARNDGQLQVFRLSTETTAIPATQMTQQQKIAAALMKAGRSNPAAWDAAETSIQVAAAVTTKMTAAFDTSPELEVDSDAAGFEGYDLHPPVVLMKGTHQPAFFISWRSQRDVVQPLAWKCPLMIWGGSALTLSCIYFFIAHRAWL